MVRMRAAAGVVALSVFVLTAGGCASRPVGFSASDPPPPQPPAATYLSMLQAGVDRARAQMPAIIESADAAAKRICGGGTMYVAGSQPDFPDELLGRAGGLMDLRAMQAAPNGQFSRGDVILYGARSRFTVDDKIKIDRLRKAGVYVVGFASKKCADPYFGPDVLIDSGDAEGMPVGAGGQICPTDSVCNLIDAWAWTAEFIGACTRQGRMPICYQSYHLAGGYERAAKYRDVIMFHNDLTIPPIGTGVLGMAYLDKIELSLRQLSQQSGESFRYAAAWVQDAGPQQCAGLFMGHIFPSHFADPRAPHPLGQMLDLTKQNGIPKVFVACVFGYQQPPQLMVDSAQLRRLKLVYSTSQRAQDDVGRNIIYIDPHWPIDDGCVTVRGYDIPILPASGVMQAAVYWSLVAETAQPPEAAVAE